MNWSLDQIPAWGFPLLRTLATVGGGYLVGHLINALFIPKLVKIASRTSNHWDDILIGELKRRIPFWVLLAGVWLSLAYWYFDPDVEAFIKRAVIVVVGLSVSLAAAAVVSRVIVQYQAEVAPTVPVTGLTQNLARLFVVAIGILVIANTVGIEITPILTALGVGGLAVALALQEPLSNLFAGLFISLAGQIRVGDYIKLQSGEEGYVVDLDWRATRVRMLANNVIIIPNSKLSQTIVTNYGLPETEMSVLVQVGVEYGSDLAHVERVTIEVAKSVMLDVEGGVKTHEPFIRYHTFNNSSIDFSVILRGQEFTSQYLLKHEFIKRLHVRYAQEGITIPFPIRTLSSRDPIPVVVTQAGGGTQD